MKRFWNSLTHLSSAKHPLVRRTRLQVEALEARDMPALVAAGPAINISGGPAIVRTNQAVSQADNSGNFAVAWCSNTTGAVYTQVYSAAGAALTGRITVGATNPSDPWARVAMNRDGEFVVVWTQRLPNLNVLHSERYAADGSALAANVVAITPALLTEVTVGYTYWDDIVVAYTIGAGAARDVQATVLTPSGYVKNLTVAGTNKAEYAPSIAVNDAGDFVVGYTMDFSSLDQDLLARRFDTYGNAMDAVPFQVANTNANEFGAAVAIGGNDSFLVAYSSESAGNADLYVARYGKPSIMDVNTVLLGRTIVANSPSNEYDPSISQDALGNFVLAYTSGGIYKPGGLANDIQTVRLAQFTAEGLQQPGTTPITLIPPVPRFGANLRPSVALGSTGAVAVYESEQIFDGGVSEFDVFAQRFELHHFRAEVNWPVGMQEIALTNGQSFTLPVTIYRDWGVGGFVGLAVHSLPDGLDSSISPEDLSFPQVETRMVTFTAHMGLLNDHAEAAELWVYGPGGFAELQSLSIPIRITAGGITFYESPEGAPADTMVPGGTVTLYGAGFLPGSKVQFGTSELVAPSYINPQGTMLMVDVPSDATSGWVAVVTPTGARLVYGRSVAVGKGKILSLSTAVGNEPEGTYPGTLVTLRGYGFTRDTLVRFGDGAFLTPEYINPNAKEVYVRVPRGAVSGLITVRTSAGEFSSEQTFTVHSYRDTNAFSFPNYSSTISFSDVEDLFGDDQTTVSFWTPLGMARIPTPGALAFWGIAAAALNGNGDCFGFALESNKLRQHPEWINEGLGLPEGANPVVFSLQNNENLNHEIEKNLVAQFSAEMIGYYTDWQVSVRNSASVYWRLHDLLAQGDRPIISMQNGLDSGHAVVAYDLVGNATQFAIRTYDPNRPYMGGSEGSTSSHYSAETACDILVGNNSWSFNMADGTPWHGGMGSLIVVPTSVVSGDLHMPVSLQGMADLVFGSLPRQQAVDHVLSFLNDQGVLTAENAAAVSDAVFAELADMGGPATSLQVNAAASLVAGDTLHLELLAVDDAGRVASGFTGTAHVTSNDNAFQPFDYTFTEADQGRHVLDLTLTKAGDHSITIASDDLGTAQTIDLTVSAAAAAKLVFSQAPPTSVVAGAELNPALSVSVQDQYGNVVTEDSTDVITLNASQGPLLGMNSVAVTNGIAIFTGLSLTRAGMTSLTASAEGLADASADVNVVAAAPKQYVFGALPAIFKVGKAYNLTVTMVDAYGNVVPAYTSAVHFSSTDRRASLPADAKFTRQGQIFRVIFKTKGQQTLTVVDKKHSQLSGSLAVNVG